MYVAHAKATLHFMNGDYGAALEELSHFDTPITSMTALLRTASALLHSPVQVPPVVQWLTRVVAAVAQ